MRSAECGMPNARRGGGIRNAGAAHAAFHTPHSAILLLGPTGSGKTPVGDFLAAHGLWGRRCIHFDFGSHLRRLAAARRRPARFSPQELAVVRHSLKTGALLEDKDFPIAAKLLDAFVREKRLGPGGLIVLNGLPRHVGQAKALARTVDVRLVVCLSCSAATVQSRIDENTGGDRTGRTDDARSEVARKLRIFRRRTAPLVGFYAARGVKIRNLRVGVRTSAADIWKRINASSAPDASPTWSRSSSTGRASTARSTEDSPTAETAVSSS